MNLTSAQLRRIISIREEMERLETVLNDIVGDNRTAPIQSAAKPAKRRISAAGRARIAAGARARWAKIRAAKRGKRTARTAKSAGTAGKPKRRVSAATKAKLRAVAKARWAKVKASGKARL